jgi:hypothetical protein
MNNIKIMKTALPQEVLTQDEWLKWVKAGIAVKQNDSLDRARDMNAQYREGDFINPKYKQLIDELYSKLFQ